MNNNFVGQMPMQPVQQSQNLPQGQLLNNVVLVPDIDNTDWYPISPGGRVLFLNNAMTCFKLQCRDQNGFPGQERRWKMEGIAMPPQQNGMVTRQEFDNLSAKMDQMMQILQDFKQ